MTNPLDMTLRQARAEFVERAKKLGAPNLDPYEVEDEADGEEVLMICYRLEELGRIIEDLKRG